QTFQHIRDNAHIGVKFTDVMTDVFVFGIAQHFELGSVYAENGSVGGDPVETKGRRLEKDLQFPFAGRFARQWNDSKFGESQRIPPMIFASTNCLGRSVQ